MKFSYNWLNDLVQKKLPNPEKVAELLTMHSFEINALEKKGEDWLVDIDVLPNRACDCFSHIGIARECAVLVNSEIRTLKSVIKEDNNLKAKDFVKVQVRDKKACLRYTARVVLDVKVGPSPKFIQERLAVCGLRPINNIVDITNYVMLETGQPLHAFDGEKIKDNKIIVRFAKAKEKIVTLDEGKYTLDKDILVIADAKQPVAIAGIKGGKGPEIDKNTKIVVIESANFNPQIIRKGSQKINLKTDASIRFEHGIDPNLTETAINRTASLIQEIAGGKVAKGLVDVYPKKYFPKRIILDLDYVESLLGVKVPKSEIINILKRLGFSVSRQSSSKIFVQVPTGRMDVALSEDLIEEVGRIYGYEKIPAVLPLIPLAPPKRNDNIFWEDFAKRILKELGFTEVYNYSFIGENLKEVFGYEKGELIEIANPVSEEYRYLRASLIPGLLSNLKTNLKYFENIKIFELSKVYLKNKNLEKMMLAGAILQKREKIKNEIFFETKGTIDTFLNQLCISNIWYDSYKPTPESSKPSFWQIKRSAEIKVDRTEIGFLGEISSKILEEFKMNERLVFFEIDFEKLAKLCSEEHEFQLICRYPAAIRDLAVLVPRGILVDEVLNKINEAGGEIVRDVDLFDIYEGEEIPGGKKNLAFHIIYQAKDKTLKSAEIDETHQKIMKSLEENLEWQVRR